MNILYVHGFRSTSTGSTKIKNIKSVYPDDILFAPDLSHDFSNDLVMLSEIVENESIDLIIGVSMGGLIADFLSVRHSVDAILVNPLVDVSYLSEKAGKFWINYKTNKEFLFPEENKSLLNMLGKITTVFSKDIRKAKTTVLLGSNDTILNHLDAVNKYKGHDIIIEEDDHRFNNYFESTLKSIK